MNIYIYTFVPDQAEKEEEERKRITFQSITFWAPLLAEMILFSWLSIKDIILLDRRLVAFPFFLSYFFFFFFFPVIFVIFVCLFPPIKTRWPTP